MEKLEILYDHYKDLRQLIETLYREQNRSLLILAGSWSIFFLFNNDAQAAKDLVELIANYKIPFNIHIFKSFTWLILVYALLRYGNIIARIQFTSVALTTLEQSINQELLSNQKTKIDPRSIHMTKLRIFISDIHTFIVPFALFAYLLIITQTQIYQLFRLKNITNIELTELVEITISSITLPILFIALYHCIIPWFQTLITTLKVRCCINKKSFTQDAPAPIAKERRPYVKRRGKSKKK